MTATCPACARSLAFHTDADCIETQQQLAKVARVILRNVLPVPYRELVMGGQPMVAIALTDSQYQTLKKFAEG